ncbi:shikimate O-hydroxycinnamoyltransferase [Ranunculus cassubicifolius]
MLTVKIKSSCSVKPSEPTPDVKLFLSEWDHIKIYTHTPLLYIYPSDQVTSSSVSNPVETLKASLNRLLVSYYPLAGRLNCIEGGRFELHCNAVGVEIVEAETDSVIEDLGDFRPSLETKKLIPPFKCGGICVVIALSHIVVDGKGALGFISSWANFARGGNELSVKPFHDRTVFYRGDPLAKPRFDHTEFKASPSLLLGQEDPTEERMKESTVTMMKLSKTQVETLKKKANEGRSKDDTSREFSRFEAIAGHIWRCVSKARKLRTEQLTSLRIIADCRSRFRPPLPDGYYGNVIMVTRPVAEVGELLSGLGAACRKISEGLARLNDDYVKSATDFLVSQKDLTPFRSSDVTTGLFLGNPNLVITSWSGLPIYDADFGWGEPIFMGPAAVGVEGRSYIIPGRHEQGSFIILVRLQVAYIADFEKFFYERGTGSEKSLIDPVEKKCKNDFFCKSNL